MLEYRFEKKTVTGVLEYLINVKPPYEMLFDLSSGFLQTCDGVIEVLEGLQKVQAGETEIYTFGGSDYCIVDAGKEKAIIEYDFGESRAEIATSEIVKLLTDWKAYLAREGKCG